jgi:hypothetical protein
MASDDLTKPLENGNLARILDEISGLRAEFRTELGQVRSDLKALDGRVESLDNKVEERMKDTRPLWEGVQTQIKELRQELHDDMSKGFRDLGRQVGVLSKRTLELEATQVDFADRLATIEK